MKVFYQKSLHINYTFLNFAFDIFNHKQVVSVLGGSRTADVIYKF